MGAKFKRRCIVFDAPFFLFFHVGKFDLCFYYLPVFVMVSAVAGAIVIGC